MKQTRVKPDAVSDARTYFSDELKSALGKQKISVGPTAVEYVVDLLVKNMLSDNFFVRDEEGRLKENVLFDMYAAYLQGTPEQRTAALRRLGDISLLVTGFFPDSLNRKLVDIDYYFGMGGAAYKQLSALQLTNLARTLFSDLSDKFRYYADALGEVSTKSGLQNNSDLLRLYEKWLMTGSDRLKSLLAEQGIATLPIDIKQRH